MNDSQWLIAGRTQGTIGATTWWRRSWQFVKNQIETNRVAREMSKGKDKKMKATKTKIWKVQQLLNWSWAYEEKMERGIWNARRTEKSHIWGEPNRSADLFKYLKVRSYKDFFFPWGKFVNHLLVRGTISFYDQKLQFPLSEKVRCGMYQCY